MASHNSQFFILATLLAISCLLSPCLATAPRKLALVEPEPIVLKYHNGPLLKGNLTVNLIWYGKFTPIQRSILIDFIQSLSSAARTSQPSVSSWWQITDRYRGGVTKITLGRQFLDDTYSLGKKLTPAQLLVLASKLPHRSSINVVLTSADVMPDDFCMSTCGAHESGLAGKHKKVQFSYIWVGNPETQCPGQCSWPFHQPIYGPQTPPLIAPNGDVGVDGMIMNLATVLAGAVTNPYDSGYFQGPVEGGLEAVTACTGIFGSGSYPGYPGKLLVDRTTGSSFNAYGTRGRKYLLPAMWDPKTSTCKTLV